MRLQLILPIFFLLFIESIGYSQSDMDVNFVHGLGRTCPWNTSAPEIMAPLDAYSSIDDYSPTYGDITQHEINFGHQQNSVVGHSLGGLVGRYNYYDGNLYSHLVTIGTPHIGAPICELAPVNTPYLLQHWFQDLIAGPCSEFGGVFCTVLQHPIIQGLSISLIQDIIDDLTPLNSTAVNQMKPNSSFLNALNDNFQESVPEPLSANRFIYGIEDFQIHYRLLQSTLNGCSQENGSLAGTATAMGYTYFIFAIINQIAADNYYTQFIFTGDFYYLILHIQHLNRFFAWLQGAISLIQQQDLEWRLNIDGSAFVYNQSLGLYTTDGVVPAYSQGADGEMPIQYTISSYYVNHNEETEHEEAKTAVRLGLRASGVY